MTDDDLRFGDVSGSGSSNDDITDLLIQSFQALIIFYVIVKTIEVLLNIQIPLV